MFLAVDGFADAAAERDVEAILDPDAAFHVNPEWPGGADLAKNVGRVVRIDAAGISDEGARMGRPSRRSDTAAAGGVK